MMLTFLITCKMGIIHLGITSIIHDLFPEAVLLHAYSHQECLSILQYEKVGFMISDGTVDEKSALNIIRNARAMQPDTKIIMLLDDVKNNHNKSLYPAGAIDWYIGKNAPVDYIRTSILHVFSGVKA